MALILPKGIATCPPDVPLFFFAGPTTGAYDWQHNAYRQVEACLGRDRFVAALPCRYDDDHPLKTEQIRQVCGETPRQQAWEDIYLELAGFPYEKSGHPRGCIIFWIPVQRTPRPPETGVYARDTRREAGRWSAFLQMDPRVRVVFGAEPALWQDKAFGLSQITRNFDHAYQKNGLGDRFPVYETLADTVDAAITVALG